MSAPGVGFAGRTIDATPVPHGSCTPIVRTRGAGRGMTVAFYGFQQVPDVRIVTPERGWSGWFEDWPTPLLEAGIRDHHLHNPFGLHAVAGRGDRVMHIDQFELSFCQDLDWLADRAGFAKIVQRIHGRGGTVHAYVGSPLVVQSRPQSTYLPGCSPGATTLSAQLRLLGLIGACRGPLAHGCLCWGRLIGFHIRPLLDARVDAIGFDDSADFQPGDCMDRLVRSLLAKRIEVMIEPWPRKGREYPRVSWVVREVLYQRIRFGLKVDAAPVESVTAKIYRVVPADTPAGQEEFRDINTIREDHGESAFGSFQEIVEAVRSDGHTPLVRASQLKSGAIT
jgi:hypothetical protein